VGRRRVLTALDLRPVLAESPCRASELDGLLDLPGSDAPFRLAVYGPEPWVVTGFRPRLTVSARGDRLVVRDRERGARALRANPLFLLDELRGLLPRARMGIPFGGGAVGYLGYGLRTFIESVPDRRPADVPLPDLWFAIPDRFWTYPVAGGPVLAVAWIPPGASRQRCARELRERRGFPPTASPAGKPGPCPTPRSNLGKRNYLRAVRRIIEYIRAGDVYQVNLSQRLSIPGRIPPGEVFRRLTAINPAPHAAYFGMSEGALVSVSPERFLSLHGDRVATEPIKGTRRRGRTVRADRAAARELWTSAKDAAELAMIVDLERNDLGRVCRYGSVKVVEARRLESHPTVHHLVARVEGRLRDGVQLSELIAATFPGGSVTGAPKIRAMEIIEELEPTARGPYTGAIGAIGCDGRVDLSVAIRVMLFGGGRIVWPVGGGIVVDSDPDAEWEETLTKGVAQAAALRGLP